MKGFISCDWGTSSLRLRFAALPDLKLLAEEKSGEGITATFNLWQQANKPEEDRFNFYLSILKEKIKSLEQKLGASTKKAPVIISGMASSSIGMMELPYKEIPCNVDGTDLLTKKIAATPGFPHEVFIISGVRTANDVMRGEETQLVGSADASASEQLFIFPGTHSKHVFIKEGKAIEFRTYMTGEFFDLLASKSILSSSIAKNTDSHQSTNAFNMGVTDSSRNLLHGAFMVRTNQLFKKLSKEENYFYLSGLLIGNELKDLKNTTQSGIFLIGTKELCSYYEKALNLLQVKNNIKTVNADDATIKGQYKIYSSLLNQ